MKIQTCSRCKGKGNLNHVVVHCGVPGTCFRCNGSGRTKHYTISERIEIFLARCEQSLTGLEERAENVKLIQAHRLERRNARRAKQGKEPMTAEEFGEPWDLQPLRDAYRSIRKQMNEVRETRKITAAQQRTYDPAP